MEDLRLDVPELVRAQTSSGLTVEEIASRLKVSATTVYRWDRGELVPRPAKLVELAALLGSTPVRLLGLDERTLTLVQARFCAGLSGAEVASRLGVALSTYNRLERGRARKVSGDMVRRLAVALERSEAQVVKALGSSVTISTPPDAGRPGKVLC